MPEYSSVGEPLSHPRPFNQRIPEFIDSTLLLPELPSSPLAPSPWLRHQLHIAIVAQITSVRHQRPGFEYLDWSHVATSHMRRRSPNPEIQPLHFDWPADIRSFLVLPSEQVHALIAKAKAAAPSHLASTIIIPDPSAEAFRALLPFTAVLMELPDGDRIFLTRPNAHFRVAFAFVIDSFCFSPPHMCRLQHVTAVIHPRWGAIMPKPHCAMQDTQQELHRLLLTYPDDQDVINVFTGINFGVNLGFEGIVLAPSFCRPANNYYDNDITGKLASERDAGFTSTPQPLFPNVPFLPLVFNLVCCPVYGSEVRVSGKSRPIVDMSRIHTGNPPTVLLLRHPPTRPEITANIERPISVSVSPNSFCRRFEEDTWPTFQAAMLQLTQMGEGTLFIDGDAVSAYMIMKILPQCLHLLGFVQPASRDKPRDIGFVSMRNKVPLGCTTSYDTYQCLGKVIEFIFRESARRHVPMSKLFRFVDDCKCMIPPTPAFEPQTTLANRIYMDTRETFETADIPMAKWVAPHQRGTFLGHIMDSNHPLSVELKQDRRAFLIDELKAWTHTDPVYKTHRDVQSWYMTMRHGIGVVPDALIFINSTRTFMKLCFGRDRRNPGCSTMVPRSVKYGQHQLLLLLLSDKFDGVHLLLPALRQIRVRFGYSHAAATDASFAGRGAVFGTHWFGQPFDESILALARRTTSKSINFLEGVGIVDTCATGGPQWAGTVVTIDTDSLGFVQAFEKQQTNCPFIDVLLIALHHIQAIYRFKLVLRHIPGVENVSPDLLSRLQFARFRELNPLADPSPTPILPWPVTPSWPGSDLSQHTLLHPTSTPPRKTTGKPSARRGGSSHGTTPPSTASSLHFGSPGWLQRQRSSRRK